MPRCPMCRIAIPEGAAAFPFCSERCRLLDLGNWLDERYAVPGADDTSAGGTEEGEESEYAPPPRVRPRLDG